jgi:hypothetical protein
MPILGIVDEVFLQYGGDCLIANAAATVMRDSYGKIQNYAVRINWQRR